MWIQVCYECLLIEVLQCTTTYVPQSHTHVRQIVWHLQNIVTVVQLSGMTLTQQITCIHTCIHKCIQQSVYNNDGWDMFRKVVMCTTTFSFTCVWFDTSVQNSPYDSVFGKRVRTYWESRGTPDYSQMNGFRVGIYIFLEKGNPHVSKDSFPCLLLALPSGCNLKSPYFPQISQFVSTKDVYLFCGNTINFHFFQSNGILWVSANMLHMKILLPYFIYIYIYIYAV